jgi:beta-glucosidase
MSFLRGAALTTTTTLGYADTSDLGPTAGTGFYRRWPDDLARLQEVGITDIRITLDWARLQPRPGHLDPDWTEWFENLITAAEAIGLRTWATLHDHSIPRWFDNEGGFGDDEALTSWWPRWVERAADQFGDRIHGWVPFAAMPPSAPLQPWRDTWSILGGGPPVVASIAVSEESNGDLAEKYVGLTDLVGLCLSTSDRWGTTIRKVAEQLDSEPLTVTLFAPDAQDDDDTATKIKIGADVDKAERAIPSFVATIDEALDDGIDIQVCFLDPAISGPDAPFGLLDQDRALTSASDAYLAPPS